MALANTLRKSTSSAYLAESNGVLVDVSRYGDIFERYFPGEMKVFEAVGIHPTRSFLTTNPYDRKQVPENFLGVGEHSMAVSLFAGFVAEALVNANVLEVVELRRVKERALLHDVFKPQEIFFQRHYDDNGLNVNCLEVRAAVIQTLRNANVPTHLVQAVLTAGKETGHLSLKNFIRVSEKGMLTLVSAKLIDKIVHLADAMTYTTVPDSRKPSETFFVTASERVSLCQERYPYLKKGGLLVSPRGEIIDSANIELKTFGHRAIGYYNEIHQIVARQIAEEICTLLRISFDKNSIDFTSLDSAEAHLLELAKVRLRA